MTMPGAETSMRMPWLQRLRTGQWSVRRRFRCRMAHQVVEWLLSPRRAESSRVMQGGGASRAVSKRGGPLAHVVFQDVKGASGDTTGRANQGGHLWDPQSECRGSGV